jgi:hypothetical protein
MLKVNLKKDQLLTMTIYSTYSVYAEIPPTLWIEKYQAQDTTY